MFKNTLKTTAENNIKKLKKGFWIHYNESDKYPNAEMRMQIVTRYCEDAGWDYSFADENHVIINGEAYEISVRYPGWIERGNYAIKCTKS